MKPRETIARSWTQVRWTAEKGLPGASASGESHDTDLVASETCCPSGAVLPLPRDGAAKRRVQLSLQLVQSDYFGCVAGQNIVAGSKWKTLR
jgi:hypothetical protein